MEGSLWDCLHNAQRCLNRACEKMAAKLEEGEVSVKELRELTAALKELTALRRSLDGTEGGSAAVEVTFDGESDTWSQ